MAYQFKKSKSRELQEWLVAKIREAIPNEEIQIFSRLKGNVASDIDNALAQIGLAVVVSPYLAEEYENRVMNIVSTGTIAFSVIENVSLNSIQIDGVEIHADNLREAVVATIYDERFEGSIPQFQAVEDASPEDIEEVYMEDMGFLDDDVEWICNRAEAILRRMLGGVSKNSLQNDFDRLVKENEQSLEVGRVVEACIKDAMRGYKKALNVTIYKNNSKHNYNEKSLLLSSGEYRMLLVR